MQKLIEGMELKQKTAQLNQKLYGWEIYEIIDDQVVIKDWFKHYVKENGAVGSIYGVLRADPFTNKNFSNGLNYEQSQQVIKLISDYVHAHSPQRIRPLFIEETVHGHQGLNSVMYPVNLAIGASFNPELYEQMISEISQYMQSLNINVGLFSGLDIIRDSKWGRSEECFGEDPLLASAFVKKIISAGTAENFTACLKHFAAQGDPYLGQNSGSVNIGERELREIHLLAMRKYGAKADMVMAAYNEIDGIPCHLNKNLLTNILRNEYNFQGVVLADGCALNRLVNQSICAHKAAQLSLDAGVDLSLWDDVYTELTSAVLAQVVDITAIDCALKRILKLKQKLGLINNQLQINKAYKPSSYVASELAKQSIILAKNNEHLPIAKTDSILLVGAGFKDVYTLLGDYTPCQETARYNNVLEAFKQQASNVSYCHYKDCSEVDVSKYAHVFVCCGGSSKREFDMQFDNNGAVINQQQREVDCGENADVSSIRVKPEQETAIATLKNKGAKVGAIFIQGRAYSVESIAERADSIIIAFYPGHEGANRLVNIVYGDINPSGKLPVTILKSANYNKWTYNQKKDFRNEKYIDDKGIVAFPFGHGLSYSNFEYQALKVNVTKQVINIEVMLINTSKISGYEVVQVYVEKENSQITKRQCELIAFTKIKLDGGQHAKLELQADIDLLYTYNLSMEHCLEPGRYKFFTGNSANRQCQIEVVIS